MSTETTPTVAEMVDSNARQEMTVVLGDVVKEHHRLLLRATQRRDSLRDRRVAVENELRQIDQGIAEAERDLVSMREMLGMSWSHYRSHVESR